MLLKIVFGNNIIFLQQFLSDFGGGGMFGVFPPGYATEDYPSLETSPALQYVKVSYHIASLLTRVKGTSYPFSDRSTVVWNDFLQRV